MYRVTDGAYAGSFFPAVPQNEAIKDVEVDERYLYLLTTKHILKYTTEKLYETEDH
jgi:hypothetical protein